MATVETATRLCPRPPTEAERHLARESRRQLDPTLADLLTQNDSNGTTGSVELEVRIPGRPPGSRLVIPASALKLLGTILSEMANGNVVTLTPIHAELTTKQAADLLSVSRPFLCVLLDNQEIPHRRVGRHRRVRFVDLMDYKRRTDASRSQVLDELVAQAQELGMGY
jgi:excisionase family DNA binding protein